MIKYNTNTFLLINKLDYLITILSEKNYNFAELRYFNVLIT